MTHSIKISEIFNSLQGEGKFVGVPSLFIRVFGCNFTCSGFGMSRGEKSLERFQVDPEKYKSYAELPLVHTGCDSYPSWDSRFKEFSPMLEVPGIVDRIIELLPQGKFHQNQHLILTGGEPLLGFQRAYPELLDEIYKRGLGLTDLTFETNGTQLMTRELYDYLDNRRHSVPALRTTFSVSAKLPVSGEKWDDAIRPDRIMQYVRLGTSENVYLKFVVATDEDVTDVHKAVKEYRDAGFLGAVYLMPVGGTDTGYYHNNRTVAELAKQNGYRYSPRLQVDLYRNLWGT